MPELEQPRLFRGAATATVLSAHFVMGEGWTATMTTRYEGEAWAEGGGTTYSHLTTAEMFDVVCAELAGALGL